MNTGELEAWMPDFLRTMNRMQGATIPSGPLEWIAVAIERRLDALEAGDTSGAPVATDDTSGSLVGLTMNAIGAEQYLGDKSRAAIRAVADWLVTIYPYGDGAGGWAVKALRAELEREP